MKMDLVNGLIKVFFYLLIFIYLVASASLIFNYKNCCVSACNEQIEELKEMESEPNKVNPYKLYNFTVINNNSNDLALGSCWDKPFECGLVE